jgi:hypothetical protein
MFDRKLLKLKDVARILGVSVQTARRYRTAGLLPPPVRRIDPDGDREESNLQALCRVCKDTGLGPVWAPYPFTR